MRTYVSRPFLICVVIILLAAAALRVIGLHAYPPGPHYDESVKLLVTRSILNGAHYFPMIEAYQGREPLYFYLGAPMLALIHDGPFALRVLSVFINLITVAASIALGRALFPGRRGVIVGLAIGIGLAVSFHQVWLSRQIFRAVSLPMMQAIAVWCLVRGLRMPSLRRAWPWLIAAGGFAGGALYTYNASRLFPLWIGLGLLTWWAASGWTRRALARALVVGLALTVTAAPMLVYAVQRPAIFFGRLAEVTQPDQSVTLLESIVLHLRMFAIEGDPYFRYNLSGRPYFTPLEGLLLLIGMAAAVIGLARRGSPAIARLGYALALLSPLMVIPSVISVGGIPPSHMRSLGMVPLIFLLVALGADWTLARLDRAIRRLPLRPGLAVSAIGLLALLGGGLLTGSAYFRWAGDAAVFYETDADLAAAADWARTHALPGERVYVAARDKGHPTVMIANLPDVAWLGTDSLILPPSGMSGLYLFPRSAPPEAAFLPLLENGRIADLPLAPDGRTAFEAFRFTLTERGVEPLPVANTYLRFAEMHAPSVPAGEAVTITTRWNVLRTPEVGDFTPIVQIEQDDGIVVARGDAYMADTDTWRPGETVFQQVTLTVPPLTPIGSYRVRLTWVARAADRYAPYLHEDGSQAGLWADVGTLTVTRPAQPIDPAAIAVPLRIDRPLTPALHLVGISAVPESIGEGESLPLTLFVAVTSQPTGPANVRFILEPVDGGGVETALVTLPAETWRAGDVWAVQMRPRMAQPGAWTLAVQSDGEPIALAPITVQAVDRQFAVPEGITRLDAEYAGQIAFVGYTLARADGTLTITPIWRGIVTPERDYKVFIHLVDATGTILAQHDAMPRAGSYPTTRWFPDEIVSEMIALPDLPDGAALRIGWYDPETGLRLQLRGRNATIENYVSLDYRNP